MEAFFSLAEVDRPNNEVAYEAFAYSTAKLYLGRARSLANKEMKESSIWEALHQGSSLRDSAEQLIDILHSGSVYHHTRAPQESYMMAADILRALKKTPLECQIAASSLLDYDNLVEFSKDQNISLFDAMREQKRLREIIRRVLEDNADEKKFPEAAE